MNVDALLLVLQAQHPDINCTTLVVGPDEPVRLGVVHPFCELRSVDKWSGSKWERTAHQLQRDELVDSACNWIVVSSGAEDSLFQLLYAQHTELVLVRPAQPSVASSTDDEHRAIREKQLRLESIGIRSVSAKEFSVQPDQYVWLTYRFVREVFDAMGRDSAGVEIFLEQLQLQSTDALGELLRQYETAKDLPTVALQYVAKWSLRMFLGLKDPDYSPEKAFNFWPVVGEPEAVAYVWASQFPTSVFRRDFGQSEWQLLIAGRDYEYRPDTAQYTIGSWLMVAADQPCSIRLRFADGSTMLRRLIPALPSEISVEEAERVRRFRLEMYDIWRLMSLDIRGFSKRVESLVKPPFLWRAYCLAFSVYQERGAQKTEFLAEMQALAERWPADVKALLEDQFGIADLASDAYSLGQFLRAAQLFLGLLASMASAPQQENDALEQDLPLNAKIKGALKKTERPVGRRQRRSS